MFTEEEIKILKALAADKKVSLKLNAANKTMGDLIRSEFNSIDQRIREEHKPNFEPLQLELKTIRENLIKEVV